MYVPPPSFTLPFPLEPNLPFTHEPILALLFSSNIPLIPRSSLLRGFSHYTKQYVTFFLFCQANSYSYPIWTHNLKQGT